MKKFIPLILAAALCLPFAALAEDAVSSASVADFYGQTALTGDDLMNAINSFSGFYLVTTTKTGRVPKRDYRLWSFDSFCQTLSPIQAELP